MTTVDLEVERDATYGERRRSEALAAVVGTLATVGTALVLGLLAIALLGKNPLEALEALVVGPMERPNRVGRWLEDTTTLTLLGLSVAIPFRTGQISIGAEGQLYLGVLAAGVAGIYLPAPAGVAAVVATLAAASAGALAGAVPGVMKARLGANEIVATLMLNVVILQLFDYLLQERLQAPRSIAPVSEPVREQAVWPKLAELTGIALGRSNVGLVVAIVASVATLWLLRRTVLGYRMTVVGAGPDFAAYGGIDVPRTVEWSFILGGALAGVAGAHLVLGVYSRVEPGMAAGLGFLGIVVALLARTHPVAVVVAAAFYAYLRVGGDVMEQESDIGSELVVIIQAVIVLLITAQALPALTRRLRRGRRSS